MSYFNTIYADSLLPYCVFSVYMYHRSGSIRSCWSGIKTITKSLNLSCDTVKRVLTDLEQHSYLAKWVRRYRPNGAIPPISMYHRRAKGELRPFAEPRMGSI